MNDLVLIISWALIWLVIGYAFGRRRRDPLSSMPRDALIKWMHVYGLRPIPGESYSHMRQRLSDRMRNG